MKTLMLLSLMLLSLPAFGQEPAVIEPVHVKIVARGESPESESLLKLVRAELNKSRLVAVTSHRVEYEVHVTAASTDCGFVGAVFAVTPEDRYRLLIHTGRDLESIARSLVSRLETQLFHKRDKWVW